MFYLVWNDESPKKRWSSSPFIYDYRPSHPQIQHTFPHPFGASHQDPLTVRPGFSIGLCQGSCSEVPTIQSLQLLLAKITPSHQHGKSHGEVVICSKYAIFWIGLKCLDVMIFDLWSNHYGTGCSGTSKEEHWGCRPIYRTWQVQATAHTKIAPIWFWNSHGRNRRSVI